MSDEQAFTPSPTLIPSDRRTTWPLAAVIVVMCYLAAMTLAAAIMIGKAARDWSAGLSTTATVQLMPRQGVDPDRQAQEALDILRATQGISGADLLSAEETRALIEPWVGASEAIADLPLPRLIAVRFTPGASPDVKALARRIAENVEGASLDAHDAWRDRLALFSGALGWLADGVLALIALAAMGAVIFATRAGLLAHHEIVEVLHLVGARDGFIAREFQRRFLRLGLEAGAAGAALAALTLLLGGAILNETTSYLPSVDPSLTDYAWLLTVPAAAALVAMLTARLTVLNALRRMV